MNEILEIIFCILIGFFSGVGILTTCSAIYLTIKEKQDWSEKRQKGIQKKYKRHEAYVKKQELKACKKKEKNFKRDTRWIKKEYFRGENVVYLEPSTVAYIERIVDWMKQHNFGNWIIVAHIYKDSEVIFQPHNGRYMDADIIRTWIKDYGKKRFVAFSSPEYEKEFMGTGEETC